MALKIDKADKVFSQYVRLRDKKCLRCHSEVRINEKGLPVSHNASHYWGRAKETTRFDPENVDCLCYPCHVIWGSTDRKAYEMFKIKQLGTAGYKRLMLRANLTGKKDRKMAYIVAKELLKTVK